MREYMKKYLLPIAVALLGLIAGPGAARAQSGFVVIVNDGNSAREITRDDLSRIFLKQRTDFRSGLPATPVDQAGGSAIRGAFSEAVHGRSSSAVEAFWQRQIFSGRAVPPVEKPTDEEVIAFVRGTLNGVGYVSRSAALGSGVHAVQVVDR
jgi:ABC-type phosphate transport system substrate-binding protein